MIVDTSAIVAVLQKEEGYEVIAAILRRADDLLMSAGSLTEAGTVIGGRYGQKGLDTLFGFVVESGIKIAPSTEEEARIAAAAYLRYGKGMGARGATAGARLNLGDCFAYALAKRTGEALLCTGGDFARTDLTLVPLEAL